jgi:aspartate racemase
MRKKIGIIGGAGPLATCSVYQEMIYLCQGLFGCKADKDFPHIVIVNYPFSDMLLPRDLERNHEKLRLELQSCFDLLASCGADSVGIACNTLHTLVREVHVTVPCLRHIVEVVAAEAQRLEIKRVLLLGTAATVRSSIYEALGEVVVPCPLDQIVVDQVIDRTLAGSIGRHEARLLRGVIQNARRKVDFDAVLLGCTELPLIHKRFPLVGANSKVLDTTALLAKRLVFDGFAAE